MIDFEADFLRFDHKWGLGEILINIEPFCRKGWLIRRICMNAMNDKALVEKQYQSASNLNARISIHDKYSVNKQGFGNWIVSNYKIEKGMRVLELGCGTGSMWKNQENVIGKCKELILTDLSEGMLSTARENVGDLPGVTYRMVDIQDIPFEGSSFDIVIANMMLYHVPDLQKGLSEVARVLKDNGTFYCATGGEHGIMEYVAGLLKPYGVDYRANSNFSLQNGAPKLSQYFFSVEMREYMDALEVTNLDDFMEYIFSGISFPKACTLEREKVREILHQNMVNGVLRVPKEAGLFICRR